MPNVERSARGWLIYTLFMASVLIIGVAAYLNLRRHAQKSRDRNQIAMSELTGLNDLEAHISSLEKWQKRFLKADSHHQKVVARRKIQETERKIWATIKSLYSHFWRVKNFTLKFLRNSLASLITINRRIIKLSETQPEQAFEMSNLQFRPLSELLESKLTVLQNESVLDTIRSNRRNYRLTMRNVLLMVLLISAITVFLITTVYRLRKVEFESRGKSERLLTILNSINDGVIATDTSGQILKMNPVAETLTGWKADEARNKNLSQILTLTDNETQEPLSLSFQDVVRKKASSQLIKDATLTAKDGTKHRVSDSIAPIHNGKGRVTGVVIVLRDITETRRVEEQLNHRRNMESIGKLAGGVAHDFNNMLAGIMGIAEILELRLLEKDLKDYARKIVETCWVTC